VLGPPRTSPNLLCGFVKCNSGGTFFMALIKPPTTYKQQIEKLRSRGCIIDDEAYAIDILAKVNYYRLTAYFLPFKKQDNSYREGTNINSIYNIYEFDRKL